jgi:hypothetical protein
MKREKIARKNLNTHTRISAIYEHREEKRMKEKNTQGIDEETATKDSNNTNKTADDKKLVDLRAGLQELHASSCFFPERLFFT